MSCNAFVSCSVTRK